jgi:single-strand DNA-binding protein
MNDTLVTVVGNVVDSPRRVSLKNGAVTNFRMASTSRRFDPARQEFVDGGTFWVDIECWNNLSSNVSASVSKGDPVIVRGALRTDSWETENGRRSTPRIRAFAVGPDLARGTAVFKRAQPARTAGPGQDSGVVEEPQPTAEDEQMARELAEEMAGVPNSEDYGAGSEPLYELDSENSSREPARV